MATKYKEVGPRFLAQRRWGWSILTQGGDAKKYPELDLEVCATGGYLFRKHLWKRDVCRRCEERRQKPKLQEK